MTLTSTHPTHKAHQSALVTEAAIGPHQFIASHCLSKHLHIQSVRQHLLSLLQEERSLEK